MIENKTMIETGLYKYDSSKESEGYKGEDFSKYLIAGDSSVDTLNEELDTVSLTLEQVPFREEFAPATKFIYTKTQILQREVNGEMQEVRVPYKQWDLVVNSDLVTQPVICDNSFYTHHIDFYEASALAQGRIVDDIAVTYKLQDVTLDSSANIVDLDKRTFATSKVDFDDLIKSKYDIDIGSSIYRINLGYTYEWYWGSGELKQWVDTLYYQQFAEETKVLTLPLPTLRARMTKESNEPYKPNLANTIELGACSYDVIIKKQNEITGEVTQETILINPSTSEKWWGFPNIPQVDNLYGCIYSGIYYDNVFGSSPSPKIKKIAQFVDGSPTQITITKEKNHIYSVELRLHNFTDKINTSFQLQTDTAVAPYYVNMSYVNFSIFGGWKLRDNDVRRTYSRPNVFVSFYVYGTGLQEQITYPAPPASAYDLFFKSQIASQDFFKSGEKSIMDMPLTFYVSDDDKVLLQRTPIIENVYHQKNLWQIFIEIGKYIHSVPKIKFGEDNRFLVTWQRLGRTDRKDETESNNISVFNSRKMENYVSACSSYINNAVQIGGSITEKIVPKSSSDDFLVSNSNAELVTSKPIIEILDMSITTGKQVFGIPKDTTRSLIKSDSFPNGFVFAKQIYDILPVNYDDDGSQASFRFSTNKSIAIYYNLGSNKIEGLNYRAPRINSGDPEDDYAIKKIIGIVFADYNITVHQQKEIKVNDFYFTVTYRTKDNLRNEQSRPDLRKFFVDSKYDEMPQRKQFNNQEDIIIDSKKLGHNIYGKLIKTGNTEFTITEQRTIMENLKKVGDLYAINGEWYYVAKVSNVYYSDFVLSEVIFSKDFNQLSEIIGIPSEPRFYEISEQSNVDRNVCFNKYLVLGTKLIGAGVTQKYNFREYVENRASGGLQDVAETLFPYNDFVAKHSLPKYAITRFENDIHRIYGDIEDNNAFAKEVLTPVNVHSFHNTLSITWDMVDNFSAGDSVKKPKVNVAITDNAYNTLVPVRYKDVYGRCDLVNFMLLRDIGLDYELIQKIPNIKYGYEGGATEGMAQILFNNLFLTTGTQSVGGTPSWRDGGIATLLDNREVFRGNFNIQMLTDSDRFVLSPYLWDTNKTGVTVALLSKEINKLEDEVLTVKNENGESIILAESTAGDSIFWLYYGRNLQVRIGNLFPNFDMTNVKSIAVLDNRLVPYDVNHSNRYFVCARNVDGLTNEEKKATWYINQINETEKSFFQNQ